MAGNIFQQRITPVKPKIIETQQIFVYVEEATNDKAGIASFDKDHFIVNNGKVELATLKLSSTPFDKPSLIQLDKNDFKVTNRITSVNWPYAYKGNDNANTNGWGLVKIGENSIGWLKYDTNNLLAVDTDKVDAEIDGKIAPITADVNNMKNTIDTTVALVDANNKLVAKLNSDFIKLDTKVSTYDDAIASKLNKNEHYAVPGLTVNTTIKNGDVSGEILLESEYNNLEGKFGKSRLVVNETGVYIGHVDTDTPITLEKIATQPYVQNELSKLTFIHILNTSSQLVITATSDTVQSVATKYVQDNYGRDPQQWDGLVITMTDSNNDKILYTYTAASGMWLNVGINNVDLTDYVSKDGISDININYGEESVLYNTTDGITVTSNGQIKYKDNTVHQITTEYNLPIIAGDNITIDANATNNKVIISVKGNIEAKVDKKVTYKLDEASTDICTQEVINTNTGLGLSSSLGEGKPSSSIGVTPTALVNLLYGKGDTSEIVQCGAAYAKNTGSNYRIDVHTTDTSTSRASTSTLLIDKEGVSISSNVGTGDSKTIYINDVYIASDTNNAIDLGTATSRFKNLYLAGNLSDGNNQITVANITSKQDKLTAGENITIENNVISAKGGGIKTFTGTNIELYNKIASGEFKVGDFVWLDNITKDPSITDITDTKLVDGKVLMQIVDGPHNYKRSVPMMKIYFEFRKCYTVILYNVKFKTVESSYGTGSYLKSVTSTDEFSIYKTYFTMEANPNSKVQTVSAYYWFVSVSALSGLPSSMSVPANERLDATDKILKNNEQAVTSGAVYTALEKKQATLTSEQLDAVNSGATTTKINQIATNTTNIALKQDKLTNTQLTAINSGITSEKVAQIDTNTTNIASLQTQIGNIDTLLTQIDSGSGV